MEPKSRRRVAGNRKKNSIPLSKLRAAQVVRTVVDHPRRLGELLGMLDDKDRRLRGRAAVTLAKLAESHPKRLVRISPRLAEALADDSAYVRWHIAYALGCLGSCFPTHCSGFLSGLCGRLDDENRIVRVLASKALGRVAARAPEMVRGLFESAKREIPGAVARNLRTPGESTQKPRKI